MRYARMCCECEHYYTRYNILCGRGHKPRFYMPRNGDPYDERSGHRRKCNDFKEDKSQK